MLWTLWTAALCLFSLMFGACVMLKDEEQRPLSGHPQCSEDLCYKKCFFASTNVGKICNLKTNKTISCSTFVSNWDLLRINCIFLFYDPQRKKVVIPSSVFETFVMLDKKLTTAVVWKIHNAKERNEVMNSWTVPSYSIFLDIWKL